MKTDNVKIPQELAGLRVHVAHDWLTGMRGGEKVLQAILGLFPKARLYTLLYVKGSVSPFIENRALESSFIQKLPAASRLYRHYLPLFPLAVRNMKVHDCDLLISTSHCAIKALQAPTHARHISYIHSPMRYVWDQYDQYYEQAGPLTRLGMSAARPWLQKWDVATCSRVDAFIANSDNVAGRINRHYHRLARVVHPPVDTGRFAPQKGPKDYCLVVSALVPYKRVDLAILACNELKVPLKVVGSGPEEARLRAMAGDNIQFLGWRSDHELEDIYARAKALLFPGEEDFGITPLEAMASGCPVLALGRGGALETVRGQDSPSPTGRFFYEQNTQSLMQAMELLEKDLPHFSTADMISRAAGFDVTVFKTNLLQALRHSLLYGADGYITY